MRLLDAGVQGIYGPGSNVIECVADFLCLLGRNMPPAGGELDEAAELATQTARLQHGEE